MAVLEAIRLSVWSWPARLVGVSETYFAEDFAGDLAGRITGPSEDLVEGNPHIVRGALEGLALSVEQPLLKEMYLQLLAAAVNGRPGVDAHPAFPSVIGQLDPAEAQLLTAILGRGSDLAIAGVGYETPQDPLPHGFPMPPRVSTLTRYVLPTTHPETGEFVDQPETRVWLDNWVRLRLVEVDFGISFSESSYEWVPQHPAYTNAEPPDGKTLHVMHGVLLVTDLGKAFAAAVDVEHALRPDDDNMQAP